MLWRLKHERNEAGLRILEPVEREERVFDPNRRRVILFPGAGVHDNDHPKEIAGAIKYVEQTLSPTLTREDPIDPVDILIWTYDEPYQPHDAYEKNYNLSRTFTQYGRKVGDHVISRFLLQEGEEFYQLTPEELKYRLSHLTMIGHSFGSIMNQEVSNYLRYQMERNGWDETVIKDVLKELVGVSVASVARQDYPEPNITQFFFTASNDTTAKNNIGYHLQNESRYHDILHHCGYPTELGGETDRVKIRPLASGRAYALRAWLPEDEVYWTEIAPDGTKKQRVLNKESEKETQVKITHDYRTFLNGHQALGDNIMNIVNNAIMRPVGIGDGHMLFNRIRAALVPDPHHEVSIGIPESLAARFEREYGEPPKAEKPHQR